MWKCFYEVFSHVKKNKEQAEQFHAHSLTTKYSWSAAVCPPGVDILERISNATYILPLIALAFCSSSRFRGGVEGVIPSFKQPVASFKPPR